MKPLLHNIFVSYIIFICHMWELTWLRSIEILVTGNLHKWWCGRTQLHVALWQNMWACPFKWARTVHQGSHHPQKSWMAQKSQNCTSWSSPGNVLKFGLEPWIKMDFVRILSLLCQKCTVIIFTSIRHWNSPGEEDILSRKCDISTLRLFHGNPISTILAGSYLILT